MVSLRRDTGAMAWSVALATRWPLVAVGQSVFATTEDRLHELGAKDGVPVRQVALPGTVTGPMLRAGELVLVPVAPDLIVAWHHSQEYEVWRSSPGSAITRRGVAAGRRAYFTTTANRVVAISLEDGRLLWSRPLAGVLTAPAMTEGRVVVGSTADRVSALNAADGTLAWDSPVWADVVGVAADAQRVYVTALDNVVRALNRSNGNQRWKEAIGTRARYAPLLAGTTLLISGIDPVLTGFDAPSGARRGTFEFQTEPELPVLGAAPLFLEGGAPNGVRLVLFTRTEAMGLTPRQPTSTETP